MTAFYQNDVQNSLLVISQDGNVQKETRFLLQHSSTLAETNGFLIHFGTPYDYTEKIFRHPIPVFESNPEILIERKIDNEICKGSIYVLAPNGMIVNSIKKFAVKLVKNKTLLDLPGNSFENGLWTIILIDDKNKVNSADFLMVGDHKAPNHTEQQPLDGHKNAIDQIKKQKKDVKTWLKTTFTLKEICILGESCNFSFWSSKYPDPFSVTSL